MRRAEAEAAAREALESALSYGDAERVSAAMDEDPELPHRAIGTRRWPPLLYVTYSASLGGERTEALLGCARTLLDAGADPNVGWEDGNERMSPLHGAAGIAHEPRMTALLLEAGADQDDGTSLRDAAGAEDPACLELLLDAGATLHHAMALAHAAQRGSLRTARLLRTSEADVLARAASRGQREAVEILLDLGVPVDARGPAGETALQATDDAELAALLVARGADAGKRAPADQRRADEPPYAELEWAAEAAYVRYLATSPLAQTRPCGDGFAVVTGIEDNTENGVVCSSADDATIAATLAWLADRRAPARWLLADPVAPSDLRERLVAAGASPERTAVTMGGDLDHLTLDTPLPPALAIVAVRDAARLAAWRDVAQACLFDDADARAPLLESLGLGEDAPVQHRLAMRDGRAIGAASFFLHGDTVLGQHVGVLAPERRSGVGRALVQSVAREARAAGARTIVLGPTPDRIAFYRLLGGVLRPAPRDRAFYLALPED